MNPFLVKAAAAALAVSSAGVAGHAELAGHSQSAQQTVVVKVYIVRPGDTLGAIAIQFCGTRSAYPALANASGISEYHQCRSANHLEVSRSIIIWSPGAEHDPDDRNRERQHGCRRTGQHTSNVPSAIQLLWPGADLASSRRSVERPSYGSLYRGERVRRPHLVNWPGRRTRTLADPPQPWFTLDVLPSGQCTGRSHYLAQRHRLVGLDYTIWLLRRKGKSPLSARGVATCRPEPRKAQFYAIHVALSQT